MSLWSGSLATFRESVGGTDPVPAGVAVSAVTASLAVALIAKVLRITGGEASLLEAAERESALLLRLADDDIRAFNRYRENGNMREAIEVPLEAARSALRCIELCREAIASCPARLVRTDLDAAESLLSGAARAMLLSVKSNLGRLPADDPFRREIQTNWPILPE